MNERDEIAAATPSPARSTAGSESAPAGLGGSASSGLAAEASRPRVHPSVVIPDHVLVRIVGRGSYGEVWLARSALGTLRAVKVVHRHDFGDARPFEREYRGIRKYEPVSRRHAGLIDILQVGRNEEAGYFYYVMELADPCVDGAAPHSGLTSSPAFGSPPSAVRSRAPAFLSASEADRPPAPGACPMEEYTPRTLRQELTRRGRLPVDECVRLALALAGAVEHLHEAGLVHRDIKPSNLVFVDGALKLADIGLVTDIGDARSVVGTEGYLPPEGAGTAQADLYSLGKVLYEASTGLDRRQFPVLPGEMGDRDEALRLREFNEIVVRACDPDPSRRYSTASAMCRDLERIRRGESIVRRRAWEAVARQIRGFLPAMAVVLSLLVLVLFFLDRRPTPVMPKMVPDLAAGGERASVFVLPFRVADHARPGQAFSSIEIYDAFRDALASLEGVRRSPRRSGWESREESELLSSLARTNDFHHVLAGLVDASNGTRTLRLRLHERAGSSLLWEGTFSTTDSNAVTLERAALDGLLGVLDIRVSEAERARVDRLLRAKAEALRLLAEAGRLYGRSFLVYTGVTEMIALTERARQIDPQCVGARLFRGIMVRDQALFSRPPMEAWPEAEREFSAVLDVDPTVTAALNQRAGAWVVRGWDWAWFDWHLQEEMRWQPELIRAFLRAAQLRIHGDMEASKRAQALVEAGNPTDFGTLAHCAYAQWTYRDYDKGLSLARRAAELHPDAAWPDFQIALLTAESGDYEEALRAIGRVERRTRFQLLTALRGYTYARMGQPERARQVLESLFAEGLHQTYVQPYPIARVYAALGEREKALDWLERAEADRSEFLVLTDAGGLRTDPAWDNLQDHPRFQALLKKVGLDVWPVPMHALEP